VDNFQLCVENAVARLPRLVRDQYSLSVVGVAGMRKLRALGFALSVLVAAGAARSADFVNLEWGEFRIGYESTSKPKSVTTLNKDGELGMSMALDSFSAGADGEKMEGSSSLAGEFVIQQPHYAKLPAMSVQINGTLIKTSGTTAELVVALGPGEQRIDWKADEVIAGKFSKVLTIDIKDGLLPVPFPVNVQAYVKRNPGSGPVLLTVDTIDIRVGQPNVADHIRIAPEADTQALVLPTPTIDREMRR
jgi:hypothetical protein